MCASAINFCILPVPVPIIAAGSASTPVPAISPARKMAAVMTPRPCSRMSSRSYAGNLFWGAPALMAAQRGKRQIFNKLYL